MGFLFNSLFFLVPLIWLPQTSELFEFNKLMATYAITALILGAWVIRCIWEKRIIFRRTILDIPLVIFLLSTFISLLLSIDPHVSWFGYYSRWNGGLLSLLTYASLYWAFVSNISKKQAQTTTFYFLLSGTLIAIYGLLEHFGHSASCLLVTGSFDVACWVQDVQNRVYATLGQPNWMAAYIVSLIFIPLSGLLKSQTTNPKSQINFNFSNLKNFAIFITLFLALLFTKSRSGLLAFGISSVVFWGYQFIIHKSKFIIHAIVLGICVLTLTLTIKNPIRDLMFKPTAVEKTVGTALESGGTESGSIRKIVWLGATRIWLSSIKNFLVGTGPETFAQSYYQYRPLEHNQTSEWELLYNKAHNEYLNYLATTGILGLISYLIFLGVAGWVLIKPQTTNPKSQPLGFEDWSLRLALFAGFTSITVTNFWGFSVVITQLFLFLFPAISIVLTAQNEEKSIKKGDLNYYQIFGIFVIISATFYFLLSTFWYWEADVLYARGSNAIRSYGVTQNPDYIVSAYQSHYDASKANPGEPAILSEFGLSASYLALAMRENATNSALLANQADKASFAAINISPYHPNYYKNRARTMIILSELDPKYLDLAREALLASQKISPTDPRIPYNLGLITKDKAYFQKALDLKPDFYDAQKALKAD